MKIELDISCNNIDMSNNIVNNIDLSNNVNNIDLSNNVNNIDLSNNNDISNIDLVI